MFQYNTSTTTTRFAEKLYVFIVSIDPAFISWK